MKKTKLQNIIKKFAPHGTLVNTWQLGEDILVIQKVVEIKPYIFTYTAKKK
jgi:hypothetical protein